LLIRGFPIEFWHSILYNINIRVHDLTLLKPALSTQPTYNNQILAAAAKLTPPFW